MGNNAWGGYSEEDKKQAEMEKGEYVAPRQRSKRDGGFYKHMMPKQMKSFKAGCKILGDVHAVTKG